MRTVVKISHLETKTEEGEGVEGRDGGSGGPLLQKTGGSKRMEGHQYISGEMGRARQGLTMNVGRMG